MTERYEQLRRLGVLTWTTLGMLGLLAVLIWVAGQIRIIWLPLVLALGIVYLLNPLVVGFERLRLPRILGTTLAYLITGALLVVIGSFVAPVIGEQGADLSEQLPTIVDDVGQRLEGVGASVGVEFDLWSYDQIRSWMEDPASIEGLQVFAGEAFTVVMDVFEIVALIFLAPVLAFYLLTSLPAVTATALRLTPPELRDEAAEVGSRVGRALGGFVRGQLVVALIVGILSSVGLRVIGLDLWLIIGMTAGVLNMIPFIGPWVGGALAAAVALVLGDFQMALIVTVWFFLVQQFDNHIVSPNVLRATVKLHPALIILALLAGGSLGGLFGLLIAVPLTAVAKVLSSHLWRTRVLGEPWDQAAEDLIVEYEKPDPRSLAGRVRRVGRLQLNRPNVRTRPAVHTEPSESSNTTPSPDPVKADAG